VLFQKEWLSSAFIVAMGAIRRLAISVALAAKIGRQSVCWPPFDGKFSYTALSS
jgi:hypothetical protein